MAAETLQTTIGRAIDAYRVLTELGEAVDEEWTYVNALSDAWLERLERVVADHGGEPASNEVSTAVDRAIAEIALITDRHRAIDWLSTFPQIVLLAVGEVP